MTLFFALANTYLPELSRGRSFLVELRWAAILVVAVIAAMAIVNTALDWRDQRRAGRSGQDE